MDVFLNTHINLLYTHIHIYIYIQRDFKKREREKKKERERELCAHENRVTSIIQVYIQKN